MLGLSGVTFFLSRFFQPVDGYSALIAGFAELPAALAAMVFGVLAGIAVRFWSTRAILTTGLTLIGGVFASLTSISPVTTYPQLGVALFVVGIVLGLAYTVSNDVLLAARQSTLTRRVGSAERRAA